MTSPHETLPDTDAVAVTFSVLVPCFNPGAYFQEAMASALGQLADGDEILVQDAGSTDGTRAVLDRLAAADPRLKPVVEPDDGQADALNRALNRARADWVVWLNADDILLPGALAAVRAAISAADGDVDAIVGAHRILRANGESVDIFQGQPLDKKTLLKVGCSVFSGSLVVRRQLLVDIGGFDAAYHFTMDFELQLRLAASTPRQVAIPTPIGALRFHDASKTANHWKDFIREAWALRRAHAGNRAELAAGAQGSLVQLASVPIFRLRLTKTYRRLRRAVHRQAQHR